MYSALFGAVSFCSGASLRETGFCFHDFEIAHLLVGGFGSIETVLSSAYYKIRHVFLKEFYYSFSKAGEIYSRAITMIDFFENVLREMGDLHVDLT